MPVDQPLRPKLQARLGALLRKHDLEAVAEVIRPLAHECIALTRGDAAPDAPVGTSRIGGSPDVPVDFEWPRETDGSPLCFIAQVDLAELPRIMNHPLPITGLLSLFVGSDEPAYNISFAIRHLEGELERKAMPNGGAPNGQYESLRPHTLTAAVGISLPDYCSPQCPDFSGLIPDEDAAVDRYITLCGEAREESEAVIGQLLGWPLQINGDVQRDAHLTFTKRPELRFKTFMSPGELEQLAQKRLAEDNMESWEHLITKVLPLLRDYKANEAEELEAMSEWIGLLSIQSDREVGLCIWDAGFFTAVIRQADLAAHNFDSVYCQVESS